MRDRFRARKGRPGAVRIEYTYRNGEVTQFLWLPGKFAVCWRCEGAGKHVNPAIDGHGLTREDFAEDPDFEEAYFSGRYDIRCEECRGERVLPGIDHTQLTKREAVLVAAHEKCLDRMAQYDAEDRMTRYWESGGCA